MGTSIGKVFENRFNFFKTVIGNQTLNEKFNKIYQEKSGDWTAVSKELTPENGFKPEVTKKLQFTHFLSEWSQDNEKIVGIFLKDTGTNSMRDLALNFNKEAFAKKLTENEAVPLGITAKAYAAKLNEELFQLEPTAMVQNMAGNPVESPVADRVMSGNVAVFLSNQPESFNMKTTSIYEAFQHENAFKGIAPELREGLKKEVKALQRVVALSPIPEALPVLMKTNMTSALMISDMPEQQFVKNLSGMLNGNGENVAKQIYKNAVDVRIRNEQALIALKELGQGTGVSFIDKSLYTTKPAFGNNGPIPVTQPMKYTLPMQKVQAHLAKHHLSWDLLFGDADFCECGECTSVYSAAAYFVDLLQYLRNNDLDPNATGTLKIRTDPKDISNTPLEKLFGRRPDLGCLQLTCKNTNTILPYIDLVNEIMENYVVFHFPKPFNVEEDETSAELLAQPQHTEYEAYCILHKAVYPFTLPYHQPIDAARIYLEHLGTSRYELIDTFRSPRKEKEEPDSDDENANEESSTTTTDAEKTELDLLHQAYLDRASDAEYLGLTQEEYVILTKEAFVTKEYWGKQCKKDHTSDEYRTKIGVRPVHEYYGYKTEAEMLSRDEAKKDGLTFVKKQFLGRTGIPYLDLVELLKTGFLNPNMPRGKALNTMLGIRFSYRFLQTLVNNGAGSSKEKYVKLVDFLTKTAPVLPFIDAMLHPDPCSPKKVDCCADTKDLESWVYCYFEKVGKMIVLENGEGPKLPLWGELFTNEENPQHIGTLLNDGTIVDKDGKLIGKVEMSGMVLTTDQKQFVEAFGNGSSVIFINDQDGNRVGQISRPGLQDAHEDKVFWLPISDTCNLDKVRLIHLDGSSVTVDEYDRIHRFIRLWRKMGWTIDERDKA
jgi:hypothetical protein